jgi:hypothetical protein
MRRGLIGFATGSLVMVALYAALQPRGTQAVQQGGNWLVSALRRLTSPDVAGVPQLGVTVEQRRRRVPRER